MAQPLMDRYQVHHHNPTFYPIDIGEIQPSSSPVNEPQQNHHLTHPPANHNQNNHHHPEPSSRGSPSPSHSQPGGSSSSTTPAINFNLSNREPVNARHYYELMKGNAIGLLKAEGDTDSTQNRPFSGFVFECNSTALHLASITNQEPLIHVILSHDPNLLLSPDSRGDLPIHVAARVGHLPAVTTLLTSASQLGNTCEMLQATNNHKNTPLHIALENHQCQMAEILFEECPHTFYYLNSQQVSPMYLAIKARLWDLVKSMIQTPKVDVLEAEDHLSKGTSVHAIIQDGNQGSLLQILDANERYTDVLLYSSDEKGRYPLSYAAYIGSLNEFKYIADKYPAQVFKVDRNGSFPIHHACSGGHITVVEELLSRSDTMRWLLNKKGQNILHVAAADGKLKVVNYVLKLENVGNLINMKDEDGNTPLHLASQGKHPAVVYAFTWDKRVKLNLQNKAGFTALDLAEDFHGEVPSFQERLTWMALRYANVNKSPVVETHKEIQIPNGYYSLHHEGTPMEIEIDCNQRVHHVYKRKYKYKDRVNTLLMVSTLVATVTFASGFTVPGGYYQDGSDIGLAILAQKSAFQVFVISNTIAMYSSVLAVVTLIWAHLDDLRLVLLSLDIAVPLLGIALAMMSVAYMAGLYVVLHKQFWLGILVLVMGVSFLAALLVFFVPLYSPTSRIKYKLLRYVFHVPFILMLLACEKGIRKTF